MARRGGEGSFAGGGGAAPTLQLGGKLSILTTDGTTFAGGSATGGLITAFRHLPPELRTYLIQAVVYVPLDYSLNNLTTGNGPVWAQLWLQRSASGLKILLDEGYIRAPATSGDIASVVGIDGHIALTEGDELFANLMNNSGVDVTVNLDYATHSHHDPFPDNLVRLSTEHYVIWQRQDTYTLVATPGAPLIDMTISMGTEIELIGLRAIWDTGANEGILITLIDDAATPIVLQRVALIGAGGTVSANLPGLGAAATATANAMEAYGLVLRNGIGIRITSNGGVLTLNDVLRITWIFKVRGMNRPVITDNGTGNKATQAIIYNRWR